MDFTEKTVVCCSLVLPIYRPPSLQKVVEKTFADRHKTAKLAKVFSLESFPL